MMTESYKLELKREVSRTFLKTVSAFANYNDGEVVFGVNDDGSLLGILEDTNDVSLRIENMINDSITPVPHFSINRTVSEGNVLIVLSVKKGKDTPYYCNGKAYKRADTATIEVGRFELRRLALDGINMHYEEKQALTQDLEFNVLETWLKNEVGIEKINLDILKTLNLYNKDGYFNIAGSLFADQGDLLFSGVNLVKFGTDINKILFRKTISGVCLLSQFEGTIEIFEQYYTFEEIEGFSRTKKELIPKEAFREALANAIVHRVWDINSYIQVAMFEDRIEINSPGGLPAGISKEEYFFGNISVLRNPIIAGVFNRLNIIEKFGTGVARINAEYLHSYAKPNFDISENRIRITLPIVKMDRMNLSKDEGVIFSLIRDQIEISRKEIDLITGFDKSKTIRVLNSLVDKQILVKLGSGPAVTYKLK